MKARSSAPAPAPSRYHHGDLRATLLREAEHMLREQGLQAFSLRRLAEHVGVTAPALYHHFRDKNDLLCALAEQGFAELDAATVRAIGRRGGSQRSRLQRFVSAYVGFAADHPEIYDLMFGRTLWKGGHPTESLRTVAYGTFRRYVSYVAAPSRADAKPTGRAAQGKRALRAAQVGWATVHGLCRLLIDGIYVHRSDVDDMSEAAVDVLLAASRRGATRG